MLYGNTFIGFGFIMAYIVVEWVDGGDLSVINQAWLTPKRKEAFWPPCKAQGVFNKLIKEGDPVIGEDWILHGIKRVMYETNDYEKAQKKCREAEETSNLETEGEDYSSKSKRRLKARKILSSDDDSDDVPQKQNKISIERPPRICFQESSCSNRLKVNSPIIDFDKSSIINGRLQLTSEDPHNFSINEGFYSSQINSVASSSTRTSTPNRLSEGGCSSGENTPKAISIPDRPHQPFKGVNEKILEVLYEVREQNTQILNSLQKNVPEVTGEIPNLPVELPLNQIGDLTLLESFIEASENSLSNLVTYLSTIGGKDYTSKTNRILKHLMTDHLATSFSYRGKRNKQSFCDLHLNDVVIRAVKKCDTNKTSSDIEDVIKVWLKHAPQRFAKKK